MGEVVNLRKAKEALDFSIGVAKKLEKNGFQHVRPGYALWHLCMMRKSNPLHISEITAVLIKGRVISALDTKEQEKAAKRWADYHVTSGKLRRVGADYYTAR